MITCGGTDRRVSLSRSASGPAVPPPADCISERYDLRVLIEGKAVEDAGFERKVKHAGEILFQLMDNIINDPFNAAASRDAPTGSYP